MKTIRRLRKHYDTLTAVERVNLVLAAQERDDEAEVHALESYYPVAGSLDYEGRVLRLTYAASMLAVQLLAREVLVVKQLEDLVNAPDFSPYRTPELGNLINAPDFSPYRTPELVRALRRTCPDPDSAPTTAPNTANDIANDTANDTAPDIANDIANDDKLALLLEQAAAAWFGFSAWCRDLGHDPHQVLCLAPIGSDDRDPAFFIIHQQIELLERWAHHFLPDLKKDLEDDLDQASDKVEMWRQLFVQAFRSLKIV